MLGGISAGYGASWFPARIGEDMYIIGITGPSGAGKSSAMHALESLGALSLDCDEIYHKLLISSEHMTSEIINRFGDVSTGGKIDRKKLREIVFNDAVALEALNTITHKYVWEELDREIRAFNKRGGEIASVDAIALFESSFNKECDVVVGVLAPKEQRISRIMKRDGLTREQAESRVFAQQDDSFYIHNCDYILENPYKNQREFMTKCIEFFDQLVHDI
ncbi:MAG: dephospho-CoA kinase [Oscillospiraceae bacterium]|nr:dephospho-CoA kinase [Oscillospiraceae bacterium]MCL2279589.1 dephospho-CoA kinase [Oscillospiraceae bacterium]